MGGTVGDAVFAIDSVHQPGVDEDQHHKDIDGALLCPPKAQLKTVKLDLIELVHGNDAESEGDDKPHRQEAENNPDVGPPIGRGSG